VQTSCGWDLKVCFPWGYRVVFGSRDLNKEKGLLVALIKDGNDASIRDLAKQRFPGLTSYVRVINGMQVEALVPDGFAPATLPDKKITLFPKI
jgi:hypothetical protein